MSFMMGTGIRGNKVPYLCVCVCVWKRGVVWKKHTHVQNIPCKEHPPFQLGEQLLTQFTYGHLISTTRLRIHLLCGAKQSDVISTVIIETSPMTYLLIIQVCLVHLPECVWWLCVPVHWCIDTIQYNTNTNIIIMELTLF